MPGNVATNPSLRRYCFTGVRGVGKSTVINRLKFNISHIDFVSGSNILQEIMGDEYNHFEYLPEFEKYALRIRLNEILCKIQVKNKKDIVVDSHLTVLNLKTNEIDTIFTKKDIEFYTDFILLDSNPERVYCHRSTDSTKKRIVIFDTIVKELDIERAEAIRLSNKHGIKLHIIEMNDMVNGSFLKVLSKPV